MLKLAGFIAGSALFTVFLHTPAFAAAAMLPTVTTSVECDNATGSQTDASSCSISGASASIALSPNPILQTQAGESFRAIANLSYYFEVVGGMVGTQVPVLIDTALHTTANYPLEAVSQIMVDGTTVCASSGNGSPCPSPDYVGSIHETVADGDAIRVQLYAQTDGQYGRGLTAYASVDPYIHIDPAFVGGQQYSIEVSPGVGNAPFASGVPEPATWAMMLGGFALVGGALRRQRISVSYA